MKSRSRERTGRVLAQAIVVSAFLLGFGTNSLRADTYPHYSLPELIEMADLVVVGQAEEKDGQWVIVAQEVLKGPAGKEFPANLRFGMGDWIMASKDPAVYFLKRTGGAYHVFNPGCLESLQKIDEIKAVLDMFRDPAPYIDLARHPENADFVYVLGSVFSGYEVSCPEIPRFAKIVRDNFAVDYYEEIPWGGKGEVVLDCTFDRGRKPALRVESVRPPGELADFFSKRVLTASRWGYSIPLLKPRFTITIDARWPERVGSLKSADAAAYLRQRLESAEPGVVKAALLALTKLRDQEAVPLAVKLLAHDQAEVAQTAIRFLG